MDLSRLQELLRRTYDVKDWWPAESPFEVMVGAILIQRTTWESVEPVLDRLRAEGLLEVDGLAYVDLPYLESIVRPSGFYRQKAQRIKALALYLKERHASDPMSLLTGPTDSIRKELLSLEGIGNETADIILVFGARRAKFVAAAYSIRVLRRSGVFNSGAYDEIQSFVESSLPGGPSEYSDLYAMIVQLSRDVCRPVPLCDRCPLAQECVHFTGTSGR